MCLLFSVDSELLRKTSQAWHIVGTHFVFIETIHCSSGVHTHTHTYIYTHTHTHTHIHTHTHTYTHTRALISDLNLKYFFQILNWV